MDREQKEQELEKMECATGFQMDEKVQSRIVRPGECWTHCS